MKTAHTATSAAAWTSGCRISNALHLQNSTITADVLKAAEQKLRALEAVGKQAEGNVKDEITEANNRIKKSAYSDDRRRLIFLLPL